MGSPIRWLMSSPNAADNEVELKGPINPQCLDLGSPSSDRECATPEYVVVLNRIVGLPVTPKAPLNVDGA